MRQSSVAVFKSFFARATYRNPIPLPSLLNRPILPPSPEFIDRAECGTCKAMTVREHGSGGCLEGPLDRPGGFAVDVK